MKKVFFFAFLFVCSSLIAEETLKGKWDKYSYKLGDDALLTISLSNIPRNFFVEEIPSPKSDLENFRIKDVQTKMSDEGKTSIEIRATIFGYGTIKIPLEKIKILTEKGENIYKVEIPEIKVVERISSSATPPSIAPPVQIPESFPLMETLIISLIVIVASLLLLRKLFKKKKPVEKIEKKHTFKTIEEYLIAKIEEKLKKSVLRLEDYSELTSDIKLYFEEKIGIEAIFMTTSELLETLRSSFPFNKITMSELNEIFQLSDLVKFAKHFPAEIEEKRFRGDLLMLQKELKENIMRKERAA